MEGSKTKGSKTSYNMDPVLWQEFRNGNKEAFISIYQKNYPLLLDYGMKIKYNEDFIKDCIQEVFYDLLRYVKNLGPTDSILFYLFASLRRKIFRKLKYDISFRSDDNFYFNTLSLAEKSSEDTVIHDESSQNRKKLLKAMIDHLPPRQKEALLMKFYLYFEYTDIASIMELNIQSVRNLIHEALKTLREKVKNQQTYK